MLMYVIMNVTLLLKNQNQTQGEGEEDVFPLN